MDAISTCPDSRSYGATVSLRIWHPRVLSGEITYAMGFLPSLCHDAGAPRVAPGGQPLQGIHPQTYWLFKFAFGSSLTIEECLIEALKPLKTKQEFLNGLVETGGRCEFFIGVFLNGNAGTELDANLIRQVSDLGLGLSFDVYLPDAAVKI